MNVNLNNNKGISTIISNLSLVISFCFFIIGWLISFISSFVYTSNIQYNRSWIWWIVINGLISVAVIFLVIDKDQMNGYRFALMTYLGICINWSIGLVNSLIHVNEASGNAIGVGQLLISVGYFIWILYFGCDKETTIGKFTGYNGILKNNQQANVNNNNNNANNNNNTSFNYNIPMASAENTILSEPSHINTPPPQTNLRAEALFDYTANKEDPNEISFVQGETIDIIDNNGRWWQARKADGTMGIVPSNFFKVI
ncbi:hypothetical protein BCR36DRAFT_333585 [Piromyces finnis]|uniref:SH3 domain-containing protein n=1 Tax=Piromyces finnis TaxID=1754191 RepID=A0A1Y1V1L6_9FUNG|nr:hypothetical protein BCR36DRAFT_333585 [Piromyces finnis]|eukprot:ORX45225.1 hypothetical protein BCR36DRAFT_333585 [Piromyces finnis]